MNISEQKSIMTHLMQIQIRIQMGHSQPMVLTLIIKVGAKCPEARGKWVATVTKME